MFVLWGLKQVKKLRFWYRARRFIREAPGLFECAVRSKDARAQYHFNMRRGPGRVGFGSVRLMSSMQRKFDAVSC